MASQEPRTAAGRALEALFIAAMDGARQGVLPARNEHGYYSGFRDAILAIEAEAVALDPGPLSVTCPSCPHPRTRHTSGGNCHGFSDDDASECHCVRFPDSPDEPTEALLALRELRRFVLDQGIAGPPLDAAGRILARIDQILGGAPPPERAAMTPQPSEQPRPEWVRYRLTKGESELTFRVIRGTAMILEQSDWHVESEYIEGRTSAPDPVASPALDVERLARAMTQAHFYPQPSRNRFGADTPYSLAAAIAAAYAEGQPVAEEPS